MKKRNCHKIRRWNKRPVGSRKAAAVRRKENKKESRGNIPRDSFLKSILWIMSRFIRTNSESVIIPLRTVVCPTILATGRLPKYFRKKLKIRSKSSQNLGEEAKRNKKEPGETNFLGLFLSHFSWTMGLFCGGQAQNPYLIMEATSAAKSSSAFSMPSPVAKRVKALTWMEPPSCLATSATCFSTEILFSFTKACCSRQFSS